MKENKGCLGAMIFLLGRRKSDDLLTDPREARPGQMREDGKMWVPGMGWTTQQERNRSIMEIQQQGKPAKRRKTSPGSIFRDGE